MCAFEKALFDALLPVFAQAWKDVEEQSRTSAAKAAAQPELAASELKKAA